MLVARVVRILYTAVLQHDNVLQMVHVYMQLAASEVAGFQLG